MKSFLKSLQFVSDAEIEQFEQYLQPRIILKGDYLIKENKVCSEIAFIKTGLLRSFCISHSGEEHTNCFTFSNEFMAAYSSFISGQPSEENIQAIIDTEILVIGKTDLLNLYNTSIVWQNIGRIITEQQYLDLEKRVLSFQKQTATERYEMLLKNQPHYIQYIPLKYLSSYLGISQRHLSRIRAAK